MYRQSTYDHLVRVPFNGEFWAILGNLGVLRLSSSIRASIHPIQLIYAAKLDMMFEIVLVFNILGEAIIQNPTP